MAGVYSNDITPGEVQKKLESNEKLNIIDVRELDEWYSGHISGATHIPLGTLGTRHIELDKKKPYIMVCRSGGRSGMACEFLESMGFDVANMTGGMLAWQGDVE